MMRLAFLAAIGLIGVYTLVVGVRDGLVRRRISSRVHRDGRELRGMPALIHGMAATFAGIAIAAVAIWLGVRIFWPAGS